MKFWCQEANRITRISLQMFSKRNIKTTEKQEFIRVRIICTYNCFLPQWELHLALKNIIKTKVLTLDDCCAIKFSLKAKKFKKKNKSKIRTLI